MTSEAQKLIDQEQERVDSDNAARLPGMGDNVTGKRLKSFIERVERLEHEKSALADDIKDIYAEAKGTGFAVKIIRKIIVLRKMDIEKRREDDELLELYKSAIGMD